MDAPGSRVCPVTEGDGGSYLFFNRTQDRSAPRRKSCLRRGATYAWRAKGSPQRRRGRKGRKSSTADFADDADWKKTSSSAQSAESAVRHSSSSALSASPR